MDLGLPVPDFSTLSRRGRSLDIADDPQLASDPITLIVDSTGLQVHSGRGWMQQKHGIKKARKTWRKLHIGLDPDSGEIVIPPPCNAIHGDSPMRNAHIAYIDKHGRTAWQKTTGYTNRSRVEAQIGRYKSVIGGQLQSRKFETQKTETAIAVKSLNRMTRIGRAVYERVS